MTINDNIQKLIQESKQIFITKNSKISGKGNFATTNITKNTNFGLAFTKIGNTGNPDKDYTRTELGKYTNHSDNPNLEILKKDNKYYFVSNQSIKSNTELTVNYQLFDWEGERDF